jgi:hypothetical protein
VILNTNRISHLVCSLTTLGAIALTLSGCVGASDGVRYAVPAGAGGYNAPAQPNYAPAAPMAPPYVPPTNHQMMEDPEAQTEETPLEVWAANENEAARKCQQAAESWTSEGGTVVTVQGRPQQKTSNPSPDGKFLFICRLRSEV